jgi:murein DD-endopeptidase MepM/ murein hydrolase activator NlpD
VLIGVAAGLVVGAQPAPGGAGRPAGGTLFAVTQVARSVQPGELVLLDLEPRVPVTSVTVRAFDRDVPAFRLEDGRHRALVGIDLLVPAGEHAVSLEALDAEGRRSRQVHRLTVLPKTFGTRTLKVDPRFVTPPASARARIERERARVAAAYASGRAEPYFDGPFVSPLAETVPVSSFGVRSVFNGVPRDPHGGADLASPAGTPVRAVQAGRVALAGDLYFSGNVVILDHGAGVFSLFAHLSRIDVAEGALLARGDRLGAVGATGRVTGPHLHWAVRASGARVDPFSLLSVTESRARTDTPRNQP